MTTKNWRSLLALLAASTLAIGGCSGADGKDGLDGQDGQDGAAGPAGPIGPTGPTGPKGDKGDQGDPGTPAPVSLTEKCAGCHSSIDTRHAPRNQVAVSSPVVVAPAAGDTSLSFTFNVKVDGLNRNDFTHVAGVYYWLYDGTAGAGVRYSVDLTANPVTVTQTWNGNYRVTLANFGPAGTPAGTGAPAAPAQAGSTFMLRMDTGNSQPQATVVAHVGGTPTFSVVSNDACQNCHGDFVFASQNALGVPNGHHSSNPIGYEACMVCHNRTDSMETRLGVNGTRLMGYVHGAHNSHNMPAATLTGVVSGTTYTVQKPAGVYARNGSIRVTNGVATVSSPFSFGFPGYMNNCSTCHTTAAQLAIVNAAKVSWALCMSCHENWDGFARTQAGGALENHRAFDKATAQTTCDTCHTGALSTAAHFHNGLKTERAGLLWDGEDQAVKIGATIDMAITGVTVSGTNLNVTWTATMGGTAVNPCNATVGAAAPVFFGATANAATGQVASNMSMIRTYAVGNDWVGNGAAGSPGQPASTVNLAAANTTCAGNVATTVVPVETTTGFTKGTVALQGKPQVTFTPAAGTKNEVIQVRAKSPTREFTIADGSAPAVQRRAVADMAKCLDCHKGSMYQHGGNRVDSMELCVVCHNPASNEMQNRVNMGVTAEEAYDGQAGQTYDMRTMVHAVHSAGETGKSLVYYRSNGIYFFGNDAALAAVPNWPTSGGVSCKNAEGATVTYYKVYGSSATGTVPAANPDGTCKTTGLANSTDGTWRIHNYIPVHYPRPLNDCAACHVAGSVDSVPDPTMAVGVTMENAGAAPWGNLLDDVLMGPSAASCMTCHQSGDPLVQNVYRTHAYTNGITPAAFANGRQTLIDAATP